MNFLLTNDDGYQADGMAALRRVIADFGDATVVAPTREYSGCGHQLTTYTTIRATTEPNGVIAVDGTPADCTRLGLFQYCRNVDWVIAGINRGGNLGVDHYMSGTVSAVREAALLGKRGIAISQFFRSDIPVDWGFSARMTQFVIAELLERELPAGAFWVVNLPAILSSDTMPQIVECEADHNPVELRYDVDDDGFKHVGVYFNRPRSNGSDVDVCFSGNIAVTLERIC
jgi:5'-nucleotidase